MIAHHGEQAKADRSGGHDPPHVVAEARARGARAGNNNP